LSCDIQRWAAIYDMPWRFIIYIAVSAFWVIACANLPLEVFGFTALFGFGEQLFMQRPVNVPCNLGVRDLK
jgi:hypothetical protein